MPPPQIYRKPAKRQGRPPATDGEQTRKRIMDAALLCFGEYGYRETSNRLISEMAGVTTGTIYHYFKNKRDLFLSIHQTHQDNIKDRLAPIGSSHLSLVESIQEMLRILMSLYTERPGYNKFAAVVRTEALRNPEIAEARFDRDWRDIYRLLAERGVEKGEIDPRDARALSAVLSAMILGITQHGIEATVADHQQCMRGFGLLFENGIIRPPKPD